MSEQCALEGATEISRSTFSAFSVQSRENVEIGGMETCKAFDHYISPVKMTSWGI